MPSTLSSLSVALICITCLGPVASASTILVRNLGDSGAGSLRAAVSTANQTPGADVIRFRADLKGRIKLTSGQLEITGPLTIAGPGETRLTVSGSNVSRIFMIQSDVDVSIQDLTLADGRNTIQENISILVTRGGAIQNYGGKLHLCRVSMYNNVTVDNVNSDVVGGGAIVNTDSAMLTAINCQFIDNVAYGGKRYAFGGAIANVTNSVAIIEDCTFTDNLATSGGTSYGGAIGNFGGSELTVVDCTFDENTARGTDSGETAFGGAIATRPGTVDGSGSLTTIEDCLIVANLAIGAIGKDGQSGADAGGGALYNFDSTLVMASSTLIENEAVAGSGDVMGGGAYGGAVLAAGTGSSVAIQVEINRCHFSGNIAAGGSPGSDSAGLALGGALHNTSSSWMDLRESKISENLAVAGRHGQGIGGGVYTSGTVTADRRTIRKIDGNHASTSDDNVFGTITVD